MTKSRAREITKVVAASILAIGLFSVSLMGINQWAFARAVNTTYSFPLAAEAVEVQQNQPSEGFVEPDVTISASPWQRYNPEISAYAMSMEEAAQIGAEYIWDIFGICMDGMHFEMMFSDWNTASRTYWQGSVYTSEEAAAAMAAFNEAMNEAVSRDQQLDLSAWNDRPESPTHHFMIDAVTGMRVDISGNLEAPQYISAEDIEILRDRRTFGDLWVTWFAKDIYEQIAYLGISAEQIEAYEQTAREIAYRHFNNSELVDIQLANQRGGLNANPHFDENGEVTFILETVAFAAMDDTGREALIAFPAESARFAAAITIGTQHNDFIPCTITGGIG